MDDAEGPGVVGMLIAYCAGSGVTGSPARFLRLTSG